MSPEDRELIYGLCKIRQKRNDEKNKLLGECRELRKLIKQKLYEVGQIRQINKTLTFEKIGDKFGMSRANIYKVWKKEKEKEMRKLAR